jgi:SAM-dependent methyltransferase
MSNNDWYRYYAPKRIAELTAERIAADRAVAEQDLDFVLARTGIGTSERILEIGCGWGRHTLAFAQRGFHSVTSIDIAPEPLAVARALASEHGLHCDLRQQNFMTVTDGPYGAILSLYDRSCCGFPTETEDLRSLQHLARLLHPGGWLVFGINDWPFVLPAESQRWVETKAGVELIEVVPDRLTMTCTDRLTLLHRDGRCERYELTRRHYYLPELRRLLNTAGFEIIDVLHRLAADRPYGDGSDGLFIFARRTREACGEG